MITLRKECVGSCSHRQAAAPCTCAHACWTLLGGHTPCMLLRFVSRVPWAPQLGSLAVARTHRWARLYCPVQ